MDSQLSRLNGIGPKTILKLNHLGIFTPSDLINHFPSRYIDFSHTTLIANAPLEENITIQGTVTNFKNIFTRSHKNLQMCTIHDQSGSLNIIWFNQPFLSKSMNIGSQHLFSGTITLYHNQKTMIAPVHGPHNTGKIIAIYPETSGITSTWFRKLFTQHNQILFANITDNLPKAIIDQFDLMPLKEAYTVIHNPSTFQQLESARLRLALSETLSLLATAYIQKQQYQTLSPRHILINNQSRTKKIQQFIKKLPFTLTTAQNRVWQEVLSDLSSTNKPTNRLIQGDVGSGKTIIAALATYFNFLNGHQTVIIAPTQILAQQHFKNFQSFFNKVSLKIDLITASSKGTVKKLTKNHVLIGTHALLYKNPDWFKEAGLIIFDEQHKFGVKQRSFFADKINPPHILTMTATPIPRTVSLTLLGNLDLSYIDELPVNRLPIKTFLVPSLKQSDCYHWIEQQIVKQKIQAFVVCPFIEPSESKTTIKAAKDEFNHLSTEVFPHLKLALIHGQLKQPHRDKIMTDFYQNKIQILVTTPVIEVGIDVPNATVMVIESADRFGLAQLHQLRGRVGRGAIQSYCYLFSQSSQEAALSRLKFLAGHHLGLEVAEYDLKTRGPGEVFSFLQHGFPSLKLASLSDAKLISTSSKILNLIKNTHPTYDLSHLLLDPNRATDKLTLN